VDVGVKVGKGGTQSRVESPDAVLIGTYAALRSVVDEVVGEDFVENGEVPIVLYRLDIAADDVDWCSADVVFLPCLVCCCGIGRRVLTPAAG